MPWTAENLGIEKGRNSSDTIQWMELDREGDFVLEQKLKDVSTPRRLSDASALRDSPKGYGTNGSTMVPEGQRFKIPPDSPLSDAFVQFRVRTIQKVTEEETSLVVAVDFSHSGITKLWKVLQSRLVPYCKRSGLFSPSHQNSSPERIRDWYYFLLFLISCKIKSSHKRSRVPNLLAAITHLPQQVKAGKTASMTLNRREAFSNSGKGISINQARRSTDQIAIRAKVKKRDLEKQKSRINSMLRKDGFDFSAALETNQEELHHAMTCILLTQSEGDTKRHDDGNLLHPGMLMITSENLSFVPHGKKSCLSLDLVQIESISSENDSLMILHNSKRQFLFIGLNSISPHLKSLWASSLVQQQSNLQKRLQEQTYVYCKKDERIGHRLRKLLLKTKEKYVIPKSTSFPVFSLPPCIELIAQDTTCSFHAPPHTILPIAGTFYLALEGTNFVSCEHSWRVSMPFRKILTMDITIGVGEPQVEITLKGFSNSLFFFGISRDLCEKWKNMWTESRGTKKAVKDLCYRKLIDDQGTKELIKIKQKYLKSQLSCSEKKFSKYWEYYLSIHANGYVRTDTLKRLIYLGIPNHLRGKWWCEMAGVEQKKNAPDEVPYGYMVSQFGKKPSLAVSEIARDIERSLPEHDYFQPPHEGCEVLREVLTAYSWRNSTIGYCQSMNLICALLLLYMGEENAYLLLSVICEDLLPNYFTPSMDGSLTDQNVLRSLVQEYLPQIHSHFLKFNTPIAVITLPWFLCLFIRTTPWETSVRILDLFFAFGRKILFQLALAVFRINEKTILKCEDSIDIIFALKSFMEKVDPEELIMAAFEFDSVEDSHVDELWRMHHPDVLKNIENVSSSQGEFITEEPIDKISAPEVKPEVQVETKVQFQSPEAVVSPLKPAGRRSSLQKKKSFLLRNSDAEIRSLVKRTTSPGVDGIVSILEGFTEERDIEESSFTGKRRPSLDKKFNFFDDD